MLPAVLRQAARSETARRFRRMLHEAQIDLDAWQRFHVAHGGPPPVLFDETVTAFRVTAHSAIAGQILADAAAHPGLRQIH